MKTLHLTLNAAAFDCMVTGEKEIEIREPSEWILARLFFTGMRLYLDEEEQTEEGSTKYGIKKHFDQVKFVNGYGPGRPYFIAKFRNVFIFQNPHEVHFTTGLKVKAEPGDIAIDLGEIVERGNLKPRHKMLIKRREEFVNSLSN